MHRRFLLLRHEDISGVSGTGIVAEGVQYHNGKIALCWFGEFSSVGVFDSLDALIKIHGHCGSTEIIWIDEGEALCLGTLKNRVSSFAS